MILRYLIILIFIKINITLSAFCQVDWRNVENGTSIYSNGYCDQPYVVILSGGKWLCTFTTGEGNEGAGGQYIACASSENQGKSWSKPVRIEEPGQESASWAMPYVTKFGRIYVFYDYNGDKVHSLGEKKNIREDMLGWYCYRYSDDEGNSWSKRYRLDVRKTKIDYTNNWNGDVQLLWGIGKPVNVDNGMMFAFAKIGHYMLENSEGWFFRCNNINIFDRGISFDLILELATADPQQVILELKGDNGKSFKLQKGKYGDIEVIINDGNVVSQWNSDPGLIPVYGKHNITVTIDNGPKIIQFIVDGIVCNGNQSRQFGWSRYTADMKDFQARSLIVGKLGKRDENVIGKLYQLRIYSRAILNTEAIGNQRNDIITANSQVNHNQKMLIATPKP